MDTTSNSQPNLTQQLASAEQGDAHALSEAIAAAYDTLRAIAAAYMRKERQDHTMQATALVHEAYLKLKKDGLIGPESKSAFIKAAARAMRNFLVDYARRHRADKRGGGKKPEPLPAAPGLPIEFDVDLIALNDALDQLERRNGTKGLRYVQIVQLRVFAGHTNKEVADILHISESSVEKDWRTIRAFLKIELGN